MTIEERRAAAVAIVQSISSVVDNLEGEEAQQLVLEALAYAIQEVCAIDIEAYGQLTATMANPTTKH